MAETGSSYQERCGHPHWLPVPTEDSVSFVSDIILCLIITPSAIFGFLGNLAVIIAVIKTPSLQLPSNILLCSLAITDCLTCLVTMPMFISWRLLVHRIYDSCNDAQATLFQAFWFSQYAFFGWSMFNIILISFDRHFAVSNPLQYRAKVTKTGTLKILSHCCIHFYRL